VASQYAIIGGSFPQADRNQKTAATNAEAAVAKSKNLLMFKAPYPTPAALVLRRPPVGLRFHGTRGSLMADISAKDVLTDVERLTGAPGVPVSRLIDARHALTALINRNVDDPGSKTERSAALIARAGLDNFIFRTTPDILVKGTVADLAGLKRAIILESYAELLDLLEKSFRRFGAGGKAAKRGMEAIASDPEQIDRFDPEDRGEIRAIASGFSLFAKREAGQTPSFDPQEGRPVYARLRADGRAPIARGAHSRKPRSS
jgi:hypothetical protein